MDNSEKDKLIIKRDALLVKKRVIDAIERLRERSPANKTTFRTDCYYLTDASGIHDWNEFNGLLESITSAKFEIGNGALQWGEDEVVIHIGADFDDFVKQVRDDYHRTNELLSVMKAPMPILPDNLEAASEDQLLQIIRKAENVNVPGSLYQRARIELEIRDRNNAKTPTYNVNGDFIQTGDVSAVGHSSVIIGTQPKSQEQSLGARFSRFLREHWLPTLIVFLCSVIAAVAAVMAIPHS